MTSYGVNVYASGYQLEAPPARECALTIRRVAGGEGSVLQSLDGRTGFDFTSFRLSYPLDCCGTLCARDGIKTGRRTPNGQDAFDKKLVVHTRSASRHSCREKGTL